ncbi:MAG: hypothetical protein ACLUAR_17870 [Pilosibacter sp.]
MISNTTILFPAFLNSGEHHVLAFATSTAKETESVGGTSISLRSPHRRFRTIAVLSADLDGSPKPSAVRSQHRRSAANGWLHLVGSAAHSSAEVLLECEADLLYNRRLAAAIFATGCEDRIDRAVVRAPLRDTDRSRGSSWSQRVATFLRVTGSFATMVWISVC